MKTRNIFKAAAIMALVLFASCSKEDIKDSQDNGLITLTVPAMEGFGDENAQSRTVFEFSDGDVTPPKVKWEEGDIIYIGKTSLENRGKTLKSLIDKGDFEDFKCVNVDENNIATFQGELIPEGSNVAVYTQIPDKVSCTTKDVEIKENGVVVDTKTYYAFQCAANAVKIENDNSHLAKNDLLISVFDTENPNLNFKRVFGLIKFEFTFPETVSGTGTFSCDKLRQTAVAYIANNEVVPNNISATLKIDNITVEGNSLTFCSFAPMVNNRKTPTIKYTFQIGDKTYSASVTYTQDALIRANQATIIKADLK